MRILKILGMLLVAIFIVLQFFGIDKTNPEFEKGLDLIVMEEPSVEIAQMLRSACYDCHSNETNWPWYSNIAPVSWMLEQHVEDARDNVNFSFWGEFEAEDKVYVIEKMIEEIEEDQMPLPAYLIAHSNAKLSDTQKQLLIHWLRSKQTLD